jgi:large subunit ribosomal protein L19
MDQNTAQNQENTATQTLDTSKASQFNVGDTVRVNYKIKEGESFRIQPFEGIVLAKKNAGVSKTFTVRRIGADSVGIERIFPIFSPNIESIKVVKQGLVKRAKLYYLRSKKGREATKVKELKSKA